MKNSNKLLLALTLVLLSALVITGYSLKSEFQSIDLKSAFHNYQNVATRPFKFLKLIGGNGYAIEIVQSKDRGMKVLSSRKSFLTVSHVKDTLIIHFTVASYLGNKLPGNIPKGLIITGPDISEIYSEGTNNIINHWIADDLKLTQVSTASSTLNNFNVKNFTTRSMQNSLINFQSGNKIQNLNLQLKGNASTYFSGIVYDHLSPDLSDNTSIIFTTKSVKLISKDANDILSKSK